MALYTGLRAYIFTCSYPNITTFYQDDPSNLIAAVQAALNSVLSLTYSRLLVYSVKNSADDRLEIELDGVTWQTLTALTSAQNDALVSALQSAFSGIANFTYATINIVTDKFVDLPTSGWPGQSMEQA